MLEIALLETKIGSRHVGAAEIVVVRGAVVAHPQPLFMAGDGVVELLFRLRNHAFCKQLRAFPDQNDAVIVVGVGIALVVLQGVGEVLLGRLRSSLLLLRAKYTPKLLLPKS